MTKASSIRFQRYRGGCLCGAVRFEAVGVPERPHTCSCRMCQRHTGSLTAAWVEFPKEAVAWTGPAGAPAAWRSSDGSSRAFCPRCGSSLGAIDDKPVIALLVGAFDSPNRRQLMPVYHSFRSPRPKWWRIDVDGPASRT
ncbi:MAG: GFA family protein [Methylocystis sp.]|nr:GFA family protein [Methylocystis sp.]MCA3582572.1 GFA family protein [Methylocystis sp.]MCA3586839.1 GFA family protein [Methylocystis sp.]MCA3591755.1 GFA family protein [Methylocystis sp.]